MLVSFCGSHIRYVNLLLVVCSKLTQLCVHLILFSCSAFFKCNLFFLIGLNGGYQDELVDHRLTEREWADEWKHLDHVRISQRVLFSSGLIAFKSLQFVLLFFICLFVDLVWDGVCMITFMSAHLCVCHDLSVEIQRTAIYLVF